VVAAGFDCWAAAQQQQLVLLERLAPRRHVHPRAPETRANASRPSGMHCSKGPCLLRTPHLGVPRSVFVPLHAPVTSLSPSNMDIDLLGKHPALSWSTSRCRDDLLLCSGRCHGCELAIRSASQPLVLGQDSRFGPITGSGVGLSLADKSKSKMCPQGGQPSNLSYIKQHLRYRKRGL